MINITVVVTCFNEEYNIEECLLSLLSQQYALGDFEIVVSDGGSQDKTQNIIRSYMVDESRIKLVVEPKKGTAAGRNAGIKSAIYDYVAFIDADCVAPEKWLQLLGFMFVEYSTSEESIVAAGGRNIPPIEGSKFLRAIGVAMDSFIGGFNSVQGRQFAKAKWVESLATLNVLYDKKRLLSVGGFDESLQSEGEDAELNYRLYCKGYKFLFLPESFVYHKMRIDSKSWFKNMFRYGKARARLLKRYPSMWKISFILPVLFIFGMVGIGLCFLSKIFLLPLLYFPLVFMFAIIHSFKRGSFDLALYVAWIYVIQHFGYGMGEVYGLLNTKIK